MRNPIKIIAKGFEHAGKGAWKGIKFGYRQATRPELIGILSLAGLVVPGVNLAVAAKFIMLARDAQAMFPQKGSGKHKLLWVLSQAQAFGAQLDDAGVDIGEQLKYVEAAVKVIKGQAALIDEAGNELLENDFERLAALLDEG